MFRNQLIVCLRAIGRPLHRPTPKTRVNRSRRSSEPVKSHLWAAIALSALCRHPSFRRFSGAAWRSVEPSTLTSAGIPTNNGTTALPQTYGRVSDSTDRLLVPPTIEILRSLAGRLPNALLCFICHYHRISLRIHAGIIRRGRAVTEFRDQNLISNSFQARLFANRQGND